MKRNYLIALVLILLVLLGCAPKSSLAPTAPAPAAQSVTPELPSTEPPNPTTTPTPTPISPPDTTPPSAITGLVANNAYDGKVNLWWDKSVAEDFDHYNIYLNKAEMPDVTGMKAAQQTKDIATCNCQLTGLEDGTRYYFAVTVVDKSGNENKLVACVNVTTAPMPRGTASPDISVDSYKSGKSPKWHW